MYILYGFEYLIGRKNSASYRCVKIDDTEICDRYWRKDAAGYP